MANAVQEKEACFIYCVSGGNSRYLAIGKPITSMPSIGNPSNIPARIENFIMNLFMPIPLYRASSLINITSCFPEKLGLIIQGNLLI